MAASNLLNNVLQDLEDKMQKMEGTSLPSAAFVFGMHKGGSTMLHDFVHIYTRRVNIRNIDISGHLFGAGLGDESFTREPRFAELLDQGFVYYGFRYAPAFMLMHKARFMNNKAVLLVRDPRDCVVSAYYSFRKSHTVPADSQTEMAQQIEAERKLFSDASLDEYSLSEMHRFVNELAGYAFFAHENLRIFRYEDIIFEKKRFFKAIVEHLDLPFDAQAFASALEKVDLVPNEERPDQHIRSVVPGDHKRKLSPSTIDVLNSKFSDVLNLYGYL